jgi:2-amino-4-hydroxy-6-hydroxymethyldihydropteridine diphosphokinase
MGDRLHHLRRALSALERLPGGRVLKRSRIFETAAVGASRRPYLNMAVAYRTRLSPMGLLIECKRLEAQAGRRPGPLWGPRPLDIDVLKYGRLKTKTAWLSIPHPLIMRRAFVLAPLRDLAPSWKPEGRASIASRLASLKPDPTIVRIASHG